MMIASEGALAATGPLLDRDQRRTRRFAPVKAGQRLLPPSQNSRTRGLVGQKFDQGPGQLRVVRALLDEACPAAADLPGDWSVEHDRGNPGSQRFERREAEAFVL